ncbi:SCO family protein [Bradyrhizobium betae]
MTRAWGKTLLMVALVLAAAGAAVFATTRGLRTVSADGARRLDLARAPRELPALVLLDQAGARHALRRRGGGQGRRPAHALVTFVYTQCTAVCRTSASGQAWLQQQLRERRLQDSVRLLTLSFDPVHDQPAVLRAYARTLRADPALWTFATVADPARLRSLLDAFGIVVLPDGLGGYSHNAALFLVDGHGRLAAAYDVERPDLALADVLRSRLWRWRAAGSACPARCWRWLRYSGRGSRPPWPGIWGWNCPCSRCAGLVGRALRRPAAHGLAGPWNAAGLPGLLAARCIASYWMLPVALDEAMLAAPAGMAKVAGMVLAGLLARASWHGRRPCAARLLCHQRRLDDADRRLAVPGGGCATMQHLPDRRTTGGGPRAGAVGAGLAGGVAVRDRQPAGGGSRAGRTARRRCLAHRRGVTTPTFGPRARNPIFNGPS